MMEWFPLSFQGTEDDPGYLGDPADLYIDLEDLLQRPEWHRHAACRGKGPDTFYVGRGEPSDPARAICSTCPVTVECLESARHERFGIWGGMSTRQRKADRRHAA